jgi:hypothetical protein
MAVDEGNRTSADYRAFRQELTRQVARDWSRAGNPTYRGRQHYAELELSDGQRNRSGSSRRGTLGGSPGRRFGSQPGEPAQHIGAVSPGSHSRVEPRPERCGEVRRCDDPRRHKGRKEPWRNNLRAEPLHASRWCYRRRGHGPGSLPHGARRLYCNSRPGHRVEATRRTGKHALAGC